MENLKDRPVSVYKIYLEVGHGLHIEVEDFTQSPLSLEAYSVYQQKYDPIEFYSHGFSRVTGFLDDKKTRTPNRTHYLSRTLLPQAWHQDI